MGTDKTDPTLNAMLDSHMKTFMACLHKMKENDVMTDVTLKLPDESSVSCHKIVLMASSPFFEAMFESEFKENTTQDIPLDFADAVTIKTLVEFFYSGEIDVCDDNVQTLVAASEFLHTKDLKDHCDAFMATRVDTSNWIELSRFGKKFNLMRLISAAREFILLNFQDVVKCFSDFPTLTENELIEVVSSDELNAENEDLVFSAVVRWVNHDADERKEAFSRVAPLIRFPFCNHETLNYVVSQEPLMGNSECMEFIMEAQNFNMHNHHYLYSPRTVPRRAFNGKRQRLVRFYRDYNGTQCEYADCIDGDSVKWKLLRGDHQNINQVIATPSGFIDLPVWGTCFIFTIHRDELIKVPSEMELNFNGQFIFFNGRIFAFSEDNFRASETEAEHTASVRSFRLDDRTPKWKSEAPMLHALDSFSVVQFNNKIYVFAGRDADGLSTVTQEFDPGLGEWRLRSPMPGVCENHAAVVALNDKIFVVGGKEQSLFSYEPAKDTWTVLSPTQHAYRYCSATAWKGKILVMGTEHAEEYDVEGDTWIPMDDLCCPTA
ncbi:hypothetical protein CAPTEDRAFT_192349 [Capitella teleta]|uniref:BTB domain-containing protein n=1 Tax=Capitella teleta TaxID=283909 RepID=R7TCN4_CAPTE|nr:hypothetical protein CAPTEDRAFT_192349 [Capitella teleta]|eukprot:ELT89222.1 hypothetical protein CAPTEDRAFT_192349 [Capitella teleta]